MADTSDWCDAPVDSHKCADSAYLVAQDMAKKVCSHYTVDGR